jgi:hypothetical protein
MPPSRAPVRLRQRTDCDERLIMGPPPDERALLEDWWRRCREAQWAHYASGTQLMRLHYLIGIPLVILAAFTGSAAFAAISHASTSALRWTVGVVSVLVALLGGLQTFLRLTDRAAAHRLAGADYARVRRLIEERLTATTGTWTGGLDSVRDTIDQLADRSPAIPASIWSRTEQRLRKRN